MRFKLTLAAAALALCLTGCAGAPLKPFHAFAEGPGGRLYETSITRAERDGELTGMEAAGLRDEWAALKGLAKEGR